MTDPSTWTQPVRCLRCLIGRYDLGAVTVVARYADCSVWKTPCCGVQVDDRGETGWKSRADYERITGPDPFLGPVYGNC